MVEYAKHNPDYTNAFFCLIWQMLKWWAIHLVLGVIIFVFLFITFMNNGGITQYNVPVEGSMQAVIVILILIELTIDILLIYEGYKSVRAAFYPYTAEDVISITCEKTEPSIMTSYKRATV